MNQLTINKSGISFLVYFLGASLIIMGLENIIFNKFTLFIIEASFGSIIIIFHDIIYTIIIGIIK